jgi:hypothetical protein
VGTQAKLQRKLTPQLIQPQTWTLLTYDTVIRDNRSMVREMSLIQPPYSGDFIWGRNVSWDPIEVPEDDTRVRQFAARFVRDPHGDRDDTGSQDQADTSGKDFHTGLWVFWGKANVPVGVEVWHDHTEPVAVYQAQFSATTWDY